MAASFQTPVSGYVTVLLSISVALSLLCSDASGETFFVRISGDDANSGRTPALAFRTIGHACDEARIGDTIYVGAGSYQESCKVRSKRSTSEIAALTIHADLDGVHTGDAGAVLVRPDDRRWAFDINDCSRVIISGLSIDPTASADRYGFLIRQSASVTLVDCNIERCRYGIYANQTNLSIQRCTAFGNRQGIRLIDSDEVTIRDSQLINNRYSVIASAIDSLTVEQSRLIDRDSATQVRGLHAVDVGLFVRDTEFKQTNIGIYGTRIRSAEISDCRFNQSDSHAVYLSGTGMTVRHCEFHQNRRAITLDDTLETPRLADVKITEASIGIVARSSDYQFEGVHLEDCRIGIHQQKENRLLSIDATEKVTLQGNQYAIYCNAIGAAHDTKLRIDGVDLRDNDRAVLAYNSDTEIKDCQFAGSTYAVAVLQAARLSVVGSTFAGNANAVNQCRFAIRTDAKQIQVSQCSIAHCRIGALLDSPQGNATAIRDTEFHDLSLAAIYLRGGEFHLQGDDRVTIKRSSRGIIAQRAKWSASDLTFDASVDYPAMDYEGVCQLSRIKTSGHAVGIYASRSASLSVADSEISRCERHGIVANECQGVRLSNVVARDNQNGIYVRHSNGGHASIDQCHAESNARYGFLFSGITPKANNQNVARGNLYGLVVQDHDLSIEDGTTWQIAGNRYGIIHRRGRTKIRQLRLTGNHVGFYAVDCDVDADAVAISSGHDGIIVHADHAVSIRNSTIRNLQRGIYVATRKQACEVTLDNSVIDQCDGHAVYLRDTTKRGLQATIDQLRINQTRRGITLVDCDTNFSRSQLANITETALYQLGGSMLMRACSVGSVANGWGVLVKGERSVLDRIILRDVKRAVALQSQTSSIRNSTMLGCDYGIYVHAPNSFCNLEFLTVANARAVGLYRREGSVRVTNCIFQATRLGIYNASGEGQLIHHHNLIDAGRPLLGSEPGEGERFEPPNFVDSAAGNLQLAAGSPAINAGTESETLFDLEGNERPSFEGFEMGAYEYMFPDGSVKIIQWDELAGG